MVDINTDVELEAGIDTGKEVPIGFTVPVQLDEESGELYLGFPDDLMEVMNLEAGDTIIWNQNEDGSWELLPLKRTGQKVKT